MDDELTIPAGAYIMASDPSDGLSLDEATAMAESARTERELAQVFAVAHNTAWWVEDDVYDFEKGTDEYKEAVQTTEAWFDLTEKVRNRIFEVLRREGVLIPEEGWHYTITPFMERNGYRDGCGWWIEDED